MTTYLSRTCPRSCVWKSKVSEVSVVFLIFRLSSRGRRRRGRLAWQMWLEYYKIHLIYGILIMFFILCYYLFDGCLFCLYNIYSKSRISKLIVFFLYIESNEHGWGWMWLIDKHKSRWQQRMDNLLTKYIF